MDMDMEPPVPHEPYVVPARFPKFHENSLRVLLCGRPRTERILRNLMEKRSFAWILLRRVQILQADRQSLVGG